MHNICSRFLLCPFDTCGVCCKTGHFGACFANDVLLSGTCRQVMAMTARFTTLLSQTTLQFYCLKQFGNLRNYCLNKSSVLLPKTIRQFTHFLSKTSRQCYCLAQFGNLRKGEFPTPRWGISRCFARKMPLMIW